MCMTPYLSQRSPNSFADLEECLGGGGRFGEREGPSETWKIVSPASPATQLPGGFDAITCKLIIKRLQEALQENFGN